MKLLIIFLFSCDIFAQCSLKEPFYTNQTFIIGLYAEGYNFVGFTDFNIYHFTLGASMNMDDTFIGVGLEYSHGERTDFPQLFNFPTGAVEPGDIAILSQRGTCNAIYNNFNLFFGVTQQL